MQEFYNRINDALTAACSIPFKLPISEIERISNLSLEWFYRNYEDALDNIYLMIPSEEYCNDNMFRLNRGLKLPDCVYSVDAITKSNQFTHTSTHSDISIDDFLYNNYGFGAGYDKSESLYSDAVLSYVVYASWDDTLYHVTKHPLTYKYNRINNRLFIKGDVSEQPDLILDVMIRVPLEYMANLDLFYKHVLGESYMQLGNIIGAINMELPGNATIDFSRWFDVGERMVDKVEEEVNNLKSNDFFFTTNGA